MFEELLSAFTIFFSWQNLLVILLGIIIGTVIGAIPGMTTPMAVALALPFTFTMQPITGILLLLGIYKGGLYGGSLTAILINAPGTPAASCTVIDGYPLSQQGHARKALDIALYASVFADFISNLSLILLAGFLAQFALRFGPPEFFTLIIFSLTIIASVSGDRLSYGLVSALLGLFLATIGLDTIYGTERFIFGQYELMGGLNFIPVLIGLFALPEIMNYYLKTAEQRIEVKSSLGEGATFNDFKRCFRSIFRGSIIGVILGTIPGIGAAPAAFLSYSEAKRNSKNPQNFGKGELEGVAASEAGNNGVAGATLIPLLSLGVPGDVVTAVILGAFMIHGLRPGPLMFVENLPLIYALFIGIMLSSLYLFIVGKIFIKSIAKVSLIPNHLLYPVIITLCVFGTYAINNSGFDVIVMIIIGFIGLAMLRLSIPSAPFLIAFILGPLLEDNFRQSLLLSEGDLSIFLRSPITIVFWILTLTSLILIFRMQLKKRKLSFD